MDDKVRNLLNRVKDTAQQAGQAASNTAQEMGRKAGNVVDVTRLNVKIYELQSDVDTLMKNAGQIVYNAHLGVETDEAMLNSILAELDEKNGQIMDLRAQIDGIKNQKTCPYCGAACSKDDRYCKSCGAELM